jgi:hypothetical protein
MNISIQVQSGDYTLISSGALLTINGAPVTMTVVACDEQLISVELHFHPDRHHEGRSLVRNFSEDGTIQQWHIYDSTNGESGRTASPAPVMSYEDEGIMKSIYLQLHTTRLQADGPVKVEYVWWSGVKSSGIQ